MKTCILMNINRIHYKIAKFANKYSLPFKDKLFENLTKQDYDATFCMNPNRFWSEHSPLLDKIIDKIGEDSKILDLWCWNGKDSLWLAKQWMIVDAVDLSEESIKIISTRINEEIKNNILLHQSSIKKYLNKNTKQYDFISCQNALQYDFDWQSRIEEIKHHTLPWWYNSLAWPLFNDISWNILDKQKILDLYQDWEIILIEERNNKRWNYDRPRIYFIAQKR